jgi:hypothetical protein
MGISLKVKSKSDVKSVNHPESNEPEGYEGPETHTTSGKLKLSKKVSAVAAPAKKAAVAPAKKEVAAEKDFSAPAKTAAGYASQLLIAGITDPKTDQEMIGIITKKFPSYNGNVAISRSEINNHRACKAQVEAQSIKLPIPRWIKNDAGEYIVAAGKQRSIKAPKEESKEVISKIAASLPKKAAVAPALAKKAAPAKKVTAPAKKVPSKKK